MEILFHLERVDRELFDVEVIKDDLLASEVVFVSPHDRELTLVVCSNADMRVYVQENLALDRNFRLTTEGFITLRPQVITVGQNSPNEILQHMRALIKPIIEQYKCRIINEYNQDVSDKYRGNLDTLF